MFLAHTIETNDFLICASKLPLFAPTYSLDSLLHERVLKRTPFSVPVSRGEKDETIAIIPDGFITFTNADGKTFPIWLELDRGKVDQKQFKRKVRGILNFLDSKAYEKHFATKHVTIAFAVTAGEYRLNQLRAWTQAELTAFPNGKQYEEIFLFACVPPHTETYPDPKILFFSPVWSLACSDEKYSLLVE